MNLEQIKTAVSAGEQVRAGSDLLRVWRKAGGELVVIDVVTGREFAVVAGGPEFQLAYRT